MAEALSLDESLGGFQVAEGDKEELAQLAAYLDETNAIPAIRTLKAWALGALEPVAGEAALDVGSGTGGDVVTLAQLVGPTGRAVGVEPSPGLRAVAVNRAPAVEFVDGNALSLPFEDSSFDVVRCERVLQHLSDPAKAVGEMARVLKPGGRFAQIENDWGTAIVDPADPEVFARMVDFFLARSGNRYSGRKVRGLLAGAGLEITEETAATWIEPQEGALTGIITTMITGAAAAEVITREEADAFSNGIAEAAQRGAFHQSFTMYGVAATKP
jgi:ubiquinone/menaquinone biosynthesis C-methylase UbiE